MQLTDWLGLSSIGGTDVLRKHTGNKPGRNTRQRLLKEALFMFFINVNTFININIAPERKPTLAQCGCQPAMKPSLLWLGSQVPGRWNAYQRHVPLFHPYPGPWEEGKQNSYSLSDTSAELKKSESLYVHNMCFTLIECFHCNPFLLFTLWITLFIKARSCVKKWVSIRQR